MIEKWQDKQDKQFGKYKARLLKNEGEFVLACQYKFPCGCIHTFGRSNTHIISGWDYCKKHKEEEDGKSKQRRKKKG